MSGKEKVDIYTIPPNFAESGKWFSGRIDAGNAVEAAILSLFLVKLLLELPIDGEMKIYAGVIFILPVTIFAVIGVQGERLTLFLFHVLCFLKKRRVLEKPSGKYQLERKRRIERRKRRAERRNLKRKGGNGDQSGNQRTGSKATRGTKRRKANTKRGADPSAEAEKS